jgi:hypothetical protein
MQRQRKKYAEERVLLSLSRGTGLPVKQARRRSVEIEKKMSIRSPGSVRLSLIIHPRQGELPWKKILGF